jgi:hypothetical protein
MSSRNASVTTPMTSPSTHAVPLSASSASERDRDRLANQSMVDSIAEAEAELRNTKLSLALACEEREEAYALSQQFKKQLLAAVSQLSLIQQVILRSCKHLHAVNCSLLGCSVQMKLRDLLYLLFSRCNNGVPLLFGAGYGHQGVAKGRVPQYGHQQPR